MLGLYSIITASRWHITILLNYLSTCIAIKIPFHHSLLLRNFVYLRLSFRIQYLVFKKLSIIGGNCLCRWRKELEILNGFFFFDGSSAHYSRVLLWVNWFWFQSCKFIAIKLLVNQVGLKVDMPWIGIHF